MSKKEPIALVLKPKNRDRLEKWYTDQMHEWMREGWYRDCIITDGFTGVYNLLDKELIAEFKQWAGEHRESTGHSPSI